MGLIDLYQAGSDIRDLQRSVDLMEAAVDLFYDQETGAFFDTSGQDASLILRTRDDYDAAEPTGNSVAVWNLLRLAEMTHNPKWKKLAEAALKHFGDRLREHPESLPHMLAALDFHLGTPKQVVLAGDPSGAARPGSAQGGPFHLRSQQGPSVCGRRDRPGIPGEEQPGRPGHGSRRWDGDCLRL